MCNKRSKDKLRFKGRGETAEGFAHDAEEGIWCGEFSSSLQN